MKQIEVYSCGVSLTFNVQRRGSWPTELNQVLMDHDGLHLQLRYPDGRVVDCPAPPGSGDGPLLRFTGGSTRRRGPDADGSRVRSHYWWTPLPPAADVSLVIEFPAAGIPPTAINLDGAAIGAVAERVDRWPAT